MDKYLSIITNFGCHYKCPYCIVKENGIDVPETTIDGLNNLLDVYNKNDCNIISLSGGGDPLHNYNDHKDYYDKLLNLLKTNNIPLEMHTSYFVNSFNTDICKRIVYHLRDINNLKHIKRKHNEIVRVVFVVEEKYTKEDIDYIYEFVKQSNDMDELSFRQMVDNNYNNTYYLYDYLKKYHRDRWYYIEQCDYNLYYVNGVLYNNFSEIHR